jgi:malate dehydrogenase (oxaloacetate-decarboxylating)
VLPLSNPTSRAEATPDDLVAWTDGRALVATGSPFPDVSFGGRRHEISQSNNIYVFPGLGVGALAVSASSVTDSMLRAAASAVAETSPCARTSTHAGLLPPLEHVTKASRRIAQVTAAAAREGGVGEEVDDDEIARRVDALRWAPEYRPIVELA